MGLFSKKEDGVIKKYSVVYLGGHALNPKKIYNIEFLILNDSFILKSQFGDKKFKTIEIPYSRVKSFDIVQRQVSTVEGLLGGLDSRQLNQANNINITYLLEENSECVVRIEMITGVTVMGQAIKCKELLDLLRTNKIVEAFMKTENTTSNNGDVFLQIEKLSDLHKSGILTEDEFNSKKADLLGKI